MNEAISTAWTRHAEDPEGVATDLADLVRRCGPAHVGLVAGLVVHVVGEHLGRWDEARVLCEALPKDAGRDRGIAALRLAAGEDVEVDPIERPRVMAMAAAAVAAHGRTQEAADWLREAAYLAQHLDDDDPAVRVVAVTANNLAQTLEVGARNPPEDALLRNSAQLALAAWRRAGTWLQEERAEYRLAKAHAALGEGAESVEHANRCVQICAENLAGAMEMFYSYEALGVALYVDANPTAGATALRAAEALLPDLEPAVRSKATEALARAASASES